MDITEDQIFLLLVSTDNNKNNLQFKEYSLIADSHAIQLNNLNYFANEQKKKLEEYKNRLDNYEKIIIELKNKLDLKIT